MGSSGQRVKGKESSLQKRAKIQSDKDKTFSGGVEECEKAKQAAASKVQHGDEGEQDDEGGARRPAVAGEWQGD